MSEKKKKKVNRPEFGGGLLRGNNQLIPCLNVLLKCSYCSRCFVQQRMFSFSPCVKIYILPNKNENYINTTTT